MSRSYTPLFSVFFLALCGLTLFGSPALAQLATQSITQALKASAEQTGQELQLYIGEVKTALDSASQDQMKLMLQIEKDRQHEARTPDIDYDILFSLSGIPRASAMTSMLTTSFLDGRYRELHLIKPGPGMPNYLVDSTFGSLKADPDNFKVYMNYFCDPLAQDEDMGDEFGIDCGFERTSNLGMPSPDQYADNDVARKNLQIIGLPLKPSLLFFEPSTFPSMPIGSAATQPNTNSIAESIYGAYRYFERLVLGNPPAKQNIPDLQSGTGIPSYLATQGTIARQMLASYPFAMLFAERVGTMVNSPFVAGVPQAPSPPAAAANLLKSNWGSASQDPALLAIVKQLETQPTMSMAQYLDIVANKMPMSPGYLERVNSLTPSQLEREKVFLMGIQSVLKYQINRWMEISVAIEAVR